MSDKKIVSLFGAVETPAQAQAQQEALARGNQDVLDLLDKLTRSARAGDIKSMAVALVHADDSAGRNWSVGGHDGLRLTASVSLLYHSMVDAQLNPPDEDDGA